MNFSEILRTRDQLDLGKWIDEIPNDRRIKIERAHANVKVLDRLVPEDHGPTLDIQLRTAKQRFLAYRDPLSFIRLGDCDITLLGSGYLHERIPLENLKTLKSQLVMAGLPRQGISIRPEFVQALKTTTFLGVQQNWAPVRNTTAILMVLSGLQVPPPNGVDFHLLYFMLADGSFVQYLAGKKLLLVGSEATELARRWGDSQFQSRYAALGPFNRSRVTDVFVTRTREAGGAWLDLSAATLYAAGANFDVALLGCGAMAKVLAERIRKQGRTALDVGFIFDALLGHSQRKERAVIRDAPWPKEA